MRPACEGSDVNIFFEQEKAYDPELAKLICGSCVIRQDCLTMFMREPHGIFGGLTPHQRDRLRRGKPSDGRTEKALKPIEHGTPGGNLAHIRRGETPCGPCRLAASEAQRKPINHGTRAGYEQHRRRKERPCDECRAAQAAASKAHRDAS